MASLIPGRKDRAAMGLKGGLELILDWHGF
jgi:hypothetical protein